MRRQHSGHRVVPAVADSLIVDRKDPQATLTRLAGKNVPDGNVRMRLRVGLMKATAHQAAGDLDAARVDLQALKSALPDNANLQRLLQRRLDQLARKPLRSPLHHPAGRRDDPPADTPLQLGSTQYLDRPRPLRHARPCG